MASTTWHQLAEAASGRAAAMESSSEAVTIRERNVRCTVWAPSWALYWPLVTAKQGLPGLQPNLPVHDQAIALLMARLIRPHRGIRLGPEVPIHSDGHATRLELTLH